MSDVETDTDNKKNKNDKRKRGSKSSTSDLETSLSKTTQKPKTKKPKQKNKETIDEKQSDDKMSENDQDIQIQLKEINKKLSNVLTKDDNSIKNLIRDTLKMMKNEFLESVSHRIDILEGKLFEKEEENTKLKKKLEDLEEENKKIKLEQTKVNEADKKANEKMKKEINNLEQYGRRNNLRFDGIHEDKMENAEQTGRKVAQCINALIPNVCVRRCDIDIAHRLPGKTTDQKRPRQIIVKFVSRMTRDAIFQNRKLLTRARVFVNEDLTSLNAHVLTCIRKKQPEEVELSWSNYGRLFFKNKSGSTHEVNYEDYNHWLTLDWPKK